jgi:type VI secretion system secreted protein Hcp
MECPVALSAYLRLVGEKTGAIKGSVVQKGREGKIMVIAVSHDVASPRDAASGQATGKRQHSPLVITKEVDRSTPLLHQVQATNEAIREWELQFWTPQLRAAAGVGTEVQHFTITLTNASIAAIHTEMPNNKHPDLMKLETFEQVAFAYEGITWTWTDGGITASDEWAGRID